MDKDFMNKMVDFRARHNLSQSKLAEMCKVSVMTISSIERGLQKPSPLTERKILNVIEKEGEK